MRKNYDTNEIIDLYKELIEKFSVVEDLIIKTLNNALKEQQVKVFKVVPRIKSLESILKKIYKTDCYEKPFNEIKDILSVRIISLYERDIQKICEIVENEFNIIENVEDIEKKLSPREFGYRSINYLVTLYEKKGTSIDYTEIKDIMIEIQVRTTLEHAWSEAEHDLAIFKGSESEEEGYSIKKRIFSSIISILEIANRELDALPSKFKSEIMLEKDKYRLESLMEGDASEEILKHDSYIYALIYSFVEKREFKLAQDLIAKVLKYKPKSFKLIKLKGDILLEQGNFEEAIQSYESATKIKTAYPEASVNHGVALSSLGKTEEAIEYFDKALKIDETYTEAIINKTIALSKLDRYQEALSLCDMALEQNPNDLLAMINKGYLSFKLEQYGVALNFCNKVLDIDLNNSFAREIREKILKVIIQQDINDLINIGYEMYKLKKYEDAMSIFEKALKISKDSLGAITGKGVSLTKLKRFEEAVELFDSVLEISKDDLGAIAGKAEALYDQRKYNDAIKLFDRALKLSRGDLGTIFGKGNTLLSLYKYEEAIEQFDQGLQITMLDPMCLTGKAKALNAMERFEEAEEFLDKALKYSENNIDAIIAKADSLRGLKLYDEAFSMLDQALSIDSEAYNAITGKGRILRDQQKYDDAFKLFDSVLEKDKANFEALYNKANLLQKIQLNEESKKLYEKALVLEPDNSKIKEHLKSLK